MWRVAVNHHAAHVEELLGSRLAACGEQVLEALKHDIVATSRAVHHVSAARQRRLNPRGVEQIQLLEFDAEPGQPPGVSAAVDQRHHFATGEDDQPLHECRTDKPRRPNHSYTHAISASLWFGPLEARYQS